MRGNKTPSLFHDLDLSPSARDELNFAEFPIALLSDRPAGNVSELVFRDSIRDQSNGQVVERRVRVLGIAPYGLPNSKDEEILLGLLSLTKQKNDFKSREVRFTRYELAKHLGWSADGKSYKRIDEALERWTATTLRYENSWWDAEDAEWKDVLFHVIESAIIGKPSRNGKGGAVDVQWSSIAFKSFSAGYIKNINLHFYQSLESAASKRLYRFLDKHFYRHPKLEFDLSELAFEKVGLSRDYEPWKVKQKLQPAISELEERGYLEALPQGSRYIANGRGRWRIVFVRKAEAKPRVIETKPALESPLVGELTTRGLHRDSARKLVAERKAEVIELRIEAFDWLMKRKEKERPEKPSGYLFASIEKEFPLPDGFVPSAVLKRQADEKLKAQAEETRKRREEEAAKRAEKAKIEERRGTVDAYLKGLTERERTRFEEEALSTGPKDLVEAYQKALKSGLKIWGDQTRYHLLEHAVKLAIGEKVTLSA